MSPGVSSRTPFLMTRADYGGTLAAVRCLGRAGVPVTIAADQALLPASWSRWTQRTLRCPSTQEPARLLEWLLAFGDREPGFVLYPSCDDLAYLLARHEPELRTRYLLYQPPFQTLFDLLDKKSLYAAASKAGMATPATAFPQAESEAERLAGGLRFPLLIKPRTQVLFASLNKGVVVQEPGELSTRYRDFTRLNRHAQTLLAERPDIALPMLQEYDAQAPEQIRSVAGFIDRSGELFVARAAVKVLQQPRRVGVGICFENAALEGADARAVRELCRHTGYFGVFEAEFIRRGERSLLIDFNPRFYGQMAFEIFRGLPLPLLVYLGARGDEAALRQAVEQAGAEPERTGAAYCNRFSMQLMLGLQGFSGRLDPVDRSRWRSWYAQRKGQAVDPCFEPGDALPAVLAASRQLVNALHHPRGFFRSIVLNQ